MSGDLIGIKMRELLSEPGLLTNRSLAAVQIYLSFSKHLLEAIPEARKINDRFDATFITTEIRSLLDNAVYILNSQSALSDADDLSRALFDLTKDLQLLQTELGHQTRPSHAKRVVKRPAGFESTIDTDPVTNWAELGRKLWNQAIKIKSADLYPQTQKQFLLKQCLSYYVLANTIQQESGGKEEDEEIEYISILAHLLKSELIFKALPEKTLTTIKFPGRLVPHPAPPPGSPALSKVLATTTPSPPNEAPPKPTDLTTERDPTAPLPKKALISRSSRPFEQQSGLDLVKLESSAIGIFNSDAVLDPPGV